MLSDHSTWKVYHRLGQSLINPLLYVNKKIRKVFILDYNVGSLVMWGNTDKKWLNPNIAKVIKFYYIKLSTPPTIRISVNSKLCPYFFSLPKFLWFFFSNRFFSSVHLFFFFSFVPNLISFSYHRCLCNFYN